MGILDGLDDLAEDFLDRAKGVLGSIGIDVDAVVATLGIPVRVVAGVVDEIESIGADFVTLASRIGLSPTNFIINYVQVSSGDPHGQLYQYVSAPIAPLDTLIGDLASAWSEMNALHAETARLIDAEIKAVFTEGSEFAYEGPAATALAEKHQELVNAFNTLINHTTTENTTHNKLKTGTASFLTESRTQVYSLSTPAATIGTLGFMFAPGPVAAGGGVLAGTAAGAALAALGKILLIILIAAIIILLIALLLYALYLLFVAIKDAIEEWVRDEDQTTDTPQPKPTPTPTPLPTPRPPTPLPDPDEEEDEYLCTPEMHKIALELAAKYPGVRVDIIEWLLCNGMTRDEVERLIQTMGRVGGFSKLNDLVDRLRNLRLQPGYNQLRTDQIISFLKNAVKQTKKGLRLNEMLIEIWPIYERAMNIPGIDQVLRDFVAGSDPKVRGSYFQFKWIDAHLELVDRVEVFDQNNQQGADILLKDGTVVDVKSYIWADQAFLLKLGIPQKDIQKQLEHYKNDPNFQGRPIVYYFNSDGGKLPADIQKIFDKARKEGLDVTVKYWPDPDPPVIVP